MVNTMKITVIYKKKNVRKIICCFIFSSSMFCKHEWTTLTSCHEKYLRKTQQSEIKNQYVKNFLETHSPAYIFPCLLILFNKLIQRWHPDLWKANLIKRIQGQPSKTRERQMGKKKNVNVGNITQLAGSKKFFRFFPSSLPGLQAYFDNGSQVSGTNSRNLRLLQSQGTALLDVLNTLQF